MKIRVTHRDGITLPHRDVRQPPHQQLDHPLNLTPLKTNGIPSPHHTNRLPSKRSDEHPVVVLNPDSPAVKLGGSPLNNTHHVDELGIVPLLPKPGIGQLLLNNPLSLSSKPRREVPLTPGEDGMRLPKILLLQKTEQWRNRNLNRTPGSHPSSYSSSPMTWGAVDKHLPLMLDTLIIPTTPRLNRSSNSPNNHRSVYWRRSDSRLGPPVGWSFGWSTAHGPSPCR